MGKSSSAKAEVTEYRMSIHFGVALKLDSVNKILVDEKLAWSGTASANTTLSINRPDLFGGEKKEGGLVGAIDVLLGADNQVLPASAASRYGLTASDCPAFRGLTTLMFRGSGQVTTGEFNNWDEFTGEWNGNIGDNGFLWKHNTPLIAQKVEVEGTCAPKAAALNQAYAMIGDQANPIHILYELLVDDEFGMGGSPDAIDTASYNAAAQTLFNEAFGLTILWMRQTKIEALTQEILDHIQASQYVDTNTGLWTVKLYRDDYDVEDLFVISPTNAKLSSYRVRSGGEIVNEMTVSWTNPENEKSESITGQNIASIASQGGEKVSGSRNYYGVRSAELARKLLERDLREASAPLISCEAVVDRSAWNLAPGSVVLLDWPRRNLYGLVMRVGSVNYGRPGDAKIRVPLVQDVFSLARPPIVVDPGTGWEDPSSAPAPLTMQLTTLPAYFSRNASLQTEAVSLTEPEVLVMSLADSQDDDSLDYELMADTVGPTGAIVPLSRGAKSMTPLAYLGTSLSAAATSELPAALFPDINWSPSVGGFVWIGTGDTAQEIALVTGRTATGWTIDRGCLDTVPRTWSSGTPVWAVNAGSSIVDTQVTRAAGETVTYRGLDRTSQGLLAYADAPAETATLTARPHLPLRPAKVTVGGVAFGSYAIGGATTFEIAWATRNRLLEDSQVLSWTDGPVLPEYRQETVIRAYDVATGNLVLEYGYLWLENSVTFLKASFARYASVRFEVLSRRDDLESLTGHSVIVTGFANNPAAPLPPAPPARTVPPSPGAAPGVSAFTATATTDAGPSGTQIPTITIAGTQDNPDASSLVTRYRQVGSTDWTVLPSVTLVNEAVAFEITGVQPATTYDVEVAYVVEGVVGQYRTLADVLTGSIVSTDVTPITPGNVAGTPTISITSTIASDGTQTSRLFGSWTASSNALTYVVELDNGTIVQQFPVTENAIEDRIVATGPTYRYRVKALSRTGTLSADWSSWSAYATAAGKTTKPTAIVSGSVFATGNRQIRINLKVPTDSDYSHALLYRNTTGNSPDDVPQDPIGEVFGEFYLDAAVTIGLNYRYYARSVDRTGNESDIARFLGNAIPVYEDDRTRLRVSVGGSGAARWLRVARVQSSVGRGAARVTLTADGGAFVPSAVVLDVATDWGTLGTVTILSSSVSAPFLQARLTKGTNEAYLDVQIPANSTTDIGIEVTPLPNSGGTWAALYVDSPPAGAQAICSGNLHDGAGNRFIGVISGNGGTSTSTVSSTGGGVQVNGTVGLRGTGDARLAENFINQSRFATATSLSLADADIAAPWSALDTRPAVTQGDSLTEDPAMADPSAWNTHPTDFAFVTISDGQVARTAFRGTGSTFINLRGAPVDASKTYMIEGWYRRTGSNNTAYGLVSLRDGSGAEINGDGSYWLYHPSNVTVPATWTYYSRVFGAGTGRPIPANAKEMRVGALPNYNGAAGAVEIQGLRIVEVTRIGGNLYRADGSVANESDVVTSLGTSASTNNAPWSVVSGAGRPSDNAGTIGHLRTMGVHTGIIGNKVFKATGGTHGTFQGGAVGTAQNGSAYISGSILSAGLSDGWITFFALDDDDSNFNQSGQNYYITVFANGVGTGEVALYADGTYVGGATGVPLNTNSRATIAYDGQKVMAIVDGVVYLSAPARPGQRLFPKVLDYFNSVNSAFPHGVIDVRYGAWTENTVSTVTLVPYNAETSVTGSTATKVGGSNGGWGAGVSSREKYAGAAYCSFRIGPHAQPYLMAGLVNAAFGGTYATLNYALFTEGLPASSGVHVYQNGSFVTTISGVGEWLISDVWSIVYDGVRVQFLRNGVVRHTSAAAAGQILGFGASQVYINNSLTDIQVGPANQVARLGQNTYDDADGSLIGRTNLITSLGTANNVLNQTAAATAPDFLVFNNRTDGGSVSVRSPAGGGYSPGSPVTGCLKIRLPQNWSTTMLQFIVDIYDYNVGHSVSYILAGYAYFYGPNPNDGTWLQHTAQFIGPRSRAMRVRFGHDGSYPCVYIGETSTVWEYPAVRVKDVNLGYLNIAESLWSSGWSVSLATSVGTVTAEILVPRAGDQVFGEGLLEAPTGSGLPGEGVVATRATHRTDQGTAAFLNGEGPLARSLLTEDKVRGRYLGEHSGNAAAVTAGIQNGDTYVDTSLTPFGFKVQSGGVIKEVDTSGLFRGFSTQVDVNSTTMTDKVTLNLTNIQANSYMVVWMAMDIELTPARTRKSGGTPGINPQGTWEIVEDATGGSAPKVLLSGTWEANRVGSGGSADNIESFTVDGVGEPNSDISRRWRVRAGGSRTWKLRMKTNSAENLLAVGLNVLVQIQRNPS